MKNPTPAEVNKTLDELDDSPGAIARRRILKWRSNARRDKLPIANSYATFGTALLPAERVSDALARLLNKK